MRSLPHFAVTLRQGPAWDDARGLRQQDGWDAHAEFMDGLVADGFVILGGPLGDGSGVLLVCRAEGEGAVRERLASDPWHGEGGMLVIERVEPWEVLLRAPGLP